MIREYCAATVVSERPTDSLGMDDENREEQSPSGFDLVLRPREISGAYEDVEGRRLFWSISKENQTLFVSASIANVRCTQLVVLDMRCESGTGRFIYINAHSHKNCWEPFQPERKQVSIITIYSDLILLIVIKQFLLFIVFSTAWHIQARNTWCFRVFKGHLERWPPKTCELAPEISHCVEYRPAEDVWFVYLAHLHRLPKQHKITQLRSARIESMRMAGSTEPATTAGQSYTAPYQPALNSQAAQTYSIPPWITLLDPTCRRERTECRSRRTRGDGSWAKPRSCIANVA